MGILVKVWKTIFKVEGKPILPPKKRLQKEICGWFITICRMLSPAIAVTFNVIKKVTIQRSWKLYCKLWNKIRQFAVKQKIQCMAWFDSLFSTSRQITSNTTKDFGTIHRAKTPWYFLLNFRHPDIIFTQVIRKRNLFIIHRFYNKASSGHGTMFLWTWARYPYRSWQLAPFFYGDDKP